MVTPKLIFIFFKLFNMHTECYFDKLNMFSLVNTNKTILYYSQYFVIK